MSAQLGTEWQPRAQRLADTLTEQGDIRDPAWSAAVAGVPRHVFVPQVYEQDTNAAWQPVDVTSASGMDRVYSATTLITALADRGTHFEGVSSSTKPDLMARMLEILDVRDGQRVLEIGTGSGYNAALLTHRLRDDRVFSVDLDADLVDPARDRLASIGHHPTLVVRDGAEGLAEHAPYDRIIATCSVPTVPRSWYEQLAPGGLVLVDIKVGTGAGNLVLLRRHGDRLEGRFTQRWAAFMLMRHTSDPGQITALPTFEGAHTRGTRVPPGRGRKRARRLSTSTLHCGLLGQGNRRCKPTALPHHSFCKRRSRFCPVTKRHCPRRPTTPPTTLWVSTGGACAP